MEMPHVRPVIVGGDLEHARGVAPVPADHHAVLGRQHALRRRERLRHELLGGAVDQHLRHAHRPVCHHVRQAGVGSLEHASDQVPERRPVGCGEEVVLDGGERALRDEDRARVGVRGRQLLDRGSP